MLVEHGCANFFYSIVMEILFVLILIIIIFSAIPGSTQPTTTTTQTTTTTTTDDITFASTPEITYPSSYPGSLIGLGL